MPKLDKANRRDKKRRNRNKMGMDGKATREIWRIQKKRKEKQK